MDANHYGEMVKPQINQLILSFILSTKAQNGRFEKFPTMTYQMWKKKFMSRVPNSFSSVLLFWTERRISEMQSHKVQYCNLVRHRRRPVVYCHVAKPKFKTTTTVPPNLRASSVLEKFAFLRCLLNNKYLNFCWLEIHLTIIKCLKSTKECIKSLEAKIQWSILEFSKWPIGKVATFFKGMKMRPIPFQMTLLGK